MFKVYALLVGVFMVAVGITGAQFSRTEARRVEREQEWAECRALLAWRMADAKYWAELSEDTWGNIRALAQGVCGVPDGFQWTESRWTFTECGIDVQFSDGIIGNADEYEPAEMREVCEVTNDQE